MTTPRVQNSSAYDGETPQAMQRSNTDMSMGGIYPDGMPAAVTPMERINTDMSVPGAPGDIQNTAEDVIGGQSAVFSDGNPYPVLGFGFCASRGRRPYNEDRLLLSPRVNGSHTLFPCPLLTCSIGALRVARAGGREPVFNTKYTLRGCAGRTTSTFSVCLMVMQASAHQSSRESICPIDCPR